MPEQSASIDIEKALDILEDYTLTSNQSRCQNYQVLQTALDTGENVADALLRRLLAVCVHDLKEDMKYAVNTLNVIHLILKKIKAKQCSAVPELTQSALAILHIIKTTALISKVQTLQSLCFDTFLMYPDETYIEIINDHVDEITELVNLYFHQGIPVNLRLLPFNMLHKTLKTLPPEKKATFVKDGLNLWFSKVIPTVMTLIPAHHQTMTKALDVLDMLVEDLEEIEYAENTQWQNILESIYCAQKYPAVMKTLLESGSDSWCRLWNIFVRLLKQQITMNKSKVGSPINSMLPVVEMAFKMDVQNRCRAFHCWSVLIDNFSTELNEAFIGKRLKLLIIPLKSNNAKVEETAIAKFDTWWHLIKKFEPRISKHFDLIYIPFLHFCFGNPKNASLMIPGQLSLKLKKKSVEAFVESTGHVDCDSCISSSFPHLANRILSTKLLNNYLTEWLHALKVVVKIVGAETYNAEVGSEQMRCIWKSLLECTSKLPDDYQKVVVTELLTLLLQLVQECKGEKGVQSLVFDTIIPACFDDDQCRSLLNSKDVPKDCIGPLHRILKLVMKRNTGRDSITAPEKLKMITNAIIEPAISSPNDTIQWLLKELPTNDSGLALWTALMESVIECDSDISRESVRNLLLWPLEHMQHFKNVQIAASMWNTSYTELKPKLKESTMSQDILMILMNKDKVPSSNLFLLNALFQIMKEVCGSPNNKDCKLEAELLVKTLAGVKDAEFFSTSAPVIVDSIVLMLTKASSQLDTKLAEYGLTAANSTLKLFVHANKTAQKDCHIHLEKLLNSMNLMFKRDAFVKFKTIILDQLIACTTVFNKYQSVKDSACLVLKQLLSKSKETEVPLYTLILEAIASIQGNETNKKTDSPKFTSPKVAAKKKKKEPSIVNTVVEDGEEYVVVKSNWKFNPRKLTENQKDKLQRKRDIPALYQDLSQSQDEYQLATWKTDSQDASTTASSNSTITNKPQNDDNTSILKKMQSSEVVPKILENILNTDNTKTNIIENKKDETDKDKVNDDNRSPKQNKILSLSTPKQPKSPRVLLKDRVFQNVRNLIEKSSMSPEGKSISKTLNQTVTDTVNKTPTSKPNEVKAALVNSAPPKIVGERPARNKRKPKKFEEDFEEIPLKKRRNSVISDSQNNSASSSNEPQTVDTVIDLDADITSTSTKVSPIETKDVKEVSPNDSSALNKAVDPDETNCDVIVIDDLDESVPNSVEPKVKSKCPVDTEPEPSEVKCKDVVESDQPLKEPMKDDKNEVTDSTNEENSSQPEVRTPVPDKSKETDKAKSTTKKVKKSRIEKELAIDMVEGHPFLQKEKNEKRATRKSLLATVTTSRRKALAEKLNKMSQSDSKLERKPSKKLDGQKTEQHEKKEDYVKELFKTKDSPETSISTDDLPMSEDFIESSQDSTLTTISVISAKGSAKKKSKLDLGNLQGLSRSRKSETQSLLENSSDSSSSSIKCNQEIKDDIEFSQNKSVPEENIVNNLTADMDTEPIVEKEAKNNLTSDMDTEPMAEEAKNNLTSDMDTEPMEGKGAQSFIDRAPVGDKEVPSSDDVIIINDDPELIPISSDDACVVSDSQCTASADTLPIDPNQFSGCSQSIIDTPVDVDTKKKPEIIIETPAIEEPSSTTADAIIENDTEDGLSSPYKDDEQRNQDFLNSTQEISPIKTMSPEPNESTSPDRSNDYVVIRLASPVQSNGEPLEKSGSPEIFTEDKVSPDKRDLSPPRGEMAIINNSSPTSSLSLKKNRPQVRSGGRAAQMLGLCVPDSLHNLKNTERTPDPEEHKKTAYSTPARRNLRILNNLGDNTESNTDDSEDNNENFLKFKRALPSSDSSPSVPILKRKLVDITDEATMSPASKRKRVSFHDPPVSTSICIQKYIEPLGMRSPQSSTVKKQDRPTRQTTMKSPKKLENIFKLDTVPVTPEESLEAKENTPLCSDDVDMSSLEQTPAVEIVKTSDLNDTDPICPELLACTNPISDIASELSSPAMKVLLIKELEGKINTIGDLAKLTELEVNRLCIKAPKVKVAKKVLSDYAAKQPVPENIEPSEPVPVEPMSDATIEDLVSSVPEIVPGVDMQSQTDDLKVKDEEMQTVNVSATVETQTSKVLSLSRLVQTDDSGSKTTKDIITSCLAERPDFVGKLSSHLDDASKTDLVNSLPIKTIVDCMQEKITSVSDSTLVLESVLHKQEAIDVESGKTSTSFLQEYLCKRYQSNELIMFCSELLRKVHDKSTS
ncbi:unnamed protein product [Plutella xylostella]|uniref:(diamondback moth) hypothetical protein n=1 Tax=Plutella xylostella TaxID=51655 RepID=A0A8S4EFW0_PLUXY|nr:unnamed protein product [Plutella xylostella]